MADVDEITSRFVALNEQREAIDAERAPKCLPGARIGCCTYPEELLRGYMALNEYILGTHQGHIEDGATSNSHLHVLTDERVIYICENVLYVIVYHLIETGQTDAMLGALVRNEPFFAILPQAKTAKMVRNVLERLSQVVKDLDVLYKVFAIYRGWCVRLKRTFLGLRLDLKIAVLLLLRRNYSAAIAALDKLQQEVKSLEDKPLLLDTHLVQAKAYILVRNLVRTKIALSNAKNVATNINTPTYVTAEIDLLSGLLYLCESDYRTAYTYFFEAYEGFHMAVGGTHSVLFPNLARNKSKSKMLELLQLDTQEPTLVSNAAVPLIVGDPERYSCHATISDISAVFFTFYNLSEYKSQSSISHTVDFCGQHYMQFSSMLEPNLPDHGIGPMEKSPFEDGNDPIDVNTLARDDERKLVQALKYLLLAVVITGRNDELIPILSAKNKQRFTNHLEIQMIQRISECYKKSSLVEFEKLLEEYRQVILMDPILQQEIHKLYDALLERNISHILKPYSVVEISFVATKLSLPQAKVEKKLAEMILDGKLRGTIDQGNAHLEIYDEEDHETYYEDINTTIRQMTTVVDTLYEKAQRAM
ncbi:26S proteasome non-ATPase regulatory subunit 11 [Babesia sp. Xinjiang]|uniref:26S proteasome non-ATPase regulatory subunit 11 n=1 Tax=Babesia sp. Xinjiang TaxID=462227 RepID=UPI000A22C38C|nr:26S proteasome non-ATPase regulatory subunit 11 [Babesia sp. Xinjiang]ORM40222.1 26S proteasome non-ATPase regulatory subunit 11 [Babesia sp. Xinjiang]